MSDIIEADDFNPKKIYENLIKRCRDVRMWEIKCIVEESFVSKSNFPFSYNIKDGVYTCNVAAINKKEALLIVANLMPVILFVNEDEENDE